MSSALAGIDRTDSPGPAIARRPDTAGPLAVAIDVNTKIYAKLSRHFRDMEDVNTKIYAKLSRHFRDMERVYAVIARAAAKRRQWEEEKSMGGREIGAGTAFLLADAPYALADDLERDGVDRPRRLDHRVYTAK